jgi:cytoskeleton protein RodZ
MNTHVSYEGADATDSIGQQLRSARIAKGYSISDIAARMRVLSSVIEDIECERYDRLGAPIYVRGHLQSYCRQLGLPCGLVEGCADASKPPPLAPMVRSSALQRVVDFSTRSLIYIVLTASIGIPVVWFALNAPGTQQARSLTRIDPVASPSPASDAGGVASSALPGESVAAAAVTSDQPVVASLAGFYREQPGTADGGDAAAAVTTPEPDAGLLLRFEKKSWLQVRSRDGSMRDEALVGAGEERRYPLDQVGYVTLGNASGVDVSIDGIVADISTFQRADVARFAISSDGALAPARD